MISYIRGELAEILEDSIVVESGGIGFWIRVPVSVLEEMPEEGSEVKIYTYFSVREDSMQLFGFLDREDLRVFEMLLGVNGIGPKGAMGILSSLSGEDLRFAVLADDAKTISRAPGIGLKTAQKLILELKDKWKLDGGNGLRGKTKDSSSAPSRKKSGKTAQPQGENPSHNDQAEAKKEAVLALTALGYSVSESFRAVHQIEHLESMTTEQIIKEALKNLFTL